MVFNKQRLLIGRVLVLAALLSGMFGSAPLHSVQAAPKRTGPNMTDSENLQPMPAAESLERSTDSPLADSVVAGRTGHFKSNDLLEYATDGRVIPDDIMAFVNVAYASLQNMMRMIIPVIDAHYDSITNMLYTYLLLGETEEIPALRPVEK